MVKSCVMINLTQTFKILKKCNNIKKKIPKYRDTRYLSKNQIRIEKNY